MSPSTVELFYAILALVAMAAIVATVGLRLAATRIAAAGTVYRALAAAIRPHALWLSWTVAALATAGSLYFSEVAGFTPCTLCWYQRIAMYPLVIVLGVAVIARDATSVASARVLAVVGAAIAAYHIVLEWVPALGAGACDPANPCTLVWFRTFGFISLPTLALTAFLLILTLMSTRPLRADRDDHAGVAS